MTRPSSRHRTGPRRRRAGKQLPLAFRTWGGKRPGAGRKPAGDRAGVPHSRRPALLSRHPVHVTSRVCAGLPNLRARDLWRALRRVFFAMVGRPGFRIVHFSIQKNHVHLVVEASGRTALSRGMQAFKIRFAGAVNRFLGRERGTVFADRYHEHVLTTPTATRNAIAYVLLNGRRHGEDRGAPRPERWLDPRSSAAWFRGWREVGLDPPATGEPCPVDRARSWLLAEGWRRGRGGRVSVLEVPGPWPAR